MSEAKISPAFGPFLAGSGPNDTRQAIVIYRAPAPEGAHVRGRLRQLKERLDQVRARAATQRVVQHRVFRTYQEAGSKSLRGGRQPAVSGIGADTLPVGTVEVTRRTLSALARQPEVVAILPNQRVHPIRPKRVDYAALGAQESRDEVTWGLKRLDVPTVWETTRGGGIQVAVLDTGVYGAHPALAGRVKGFVVIDSLRQRITTNTTFDGDGHGTHVCGTVAGGRTPEGVSIGVAPEAELLVAAVMVGATRLSNVLEGIDWAIAQGADVISMSFGFDYYEPEFDAVFQNLIERDILPVAAIGNENHGNSSSPGNSPNAFSVGAVELGPRSRLDVPSFSSGASLEFPGQEPNSLVTKPDVVAPGVQVYSCIPPEETPEGVFHYTYMDGTSMATPHVAGVAALLMAASPATPVADIIRVLRETAWHPGGAGRRPDNRWGNGMVRPVEALKALRS